MKGAKGLLLLVLGIVLMPLGFWLGWQIEYTGQMGIPTLPYTVPGIVMFLVGVVLVPAGIYYLVKGVEE